MKQCGPDWENIPERKDANAKKSLESVELKRCVQAIIEQFLKEGTVFRSTDPIGGMHAYYVSPPPTPVLLSHTYFHFCLSHFSILSETEAWPRRFVRSFPWNRRVRCIFLFGVEKDSLNYKWYLHLSRFCLSLSNTLSFLP